jgi:hypothetical protein
LLPQLLESGDQIASSTNARKMASGILYVTMQLEADLKTSQFHDWYNNEHGPARLGLPFFTAGFRYQAADHEQPEWLAVYHCSDMSKLLSPQYSNLFKNRSPREVEVLSKVSFDRRLYDLVSSRGSPKLKLEEMKPGDIELVAVSMTLKDVEDAEVQFDRWYEEEHIDLLSKVPGWLRTRRFKTSSVAEEEEVTYLALHEYASSNGLGGKEHQTAMSTTWRDEIMTRYVKDKSRRTYMLFHVFGSILKEGINGRVA